MRAAKYLRIAMEKPTPVVYREMARMHRMRWENEKAVDFAEKAVVLDPNDADNHSVVAQALIFAGRPDEALPYCERMRRIDPACLRIDTLGIRTHGLDSKAVAVAAVKPVLDKNWIIRR